MRLLAGQTVGMKYRKLRIAWSVACGILCLLLIVLWVRSVNTFEGAQGTILPQTNPDGTRSATHLTIHSFDNVLSVIWATDRTRTRFPPWCSWSRTDQLYRESWKLTYGYHDGNLGGIQYQAPYWLLVAVASALASLQWVPIPKRFSLRTSLIATTLLAVILGLAIATTR